MAQFTRGTGGGSTESSDSSGSDSDSDSSTSTSSDFQQDQQTSRQVGGSGDSSDEPEETTDSSSDTGGGSVDTGGDDFNQDRQASRRVRDTSSSDDSGGGPGGDFGRDQETSQQVGGSGDPTDSPPQPGGDDFARDQQSSQQLGGDGGSRERPTANDAADQSFLIESEAADSDQSGDVASRVESQIEDQYGVSDAKVTAGSGGFIVEVDQKFDPEAGREREINNILQDVRDSRGEGDRSRVLNETAVPEKQTGPVDDDAGAGAGYEGKDREGFMLEVEKAADTVVDTVFQEETAESVARTFKFSEERVSDDTDISGPGFDPTALFADDEGLFQSGAPGDLNTDITDSLTGSGGFLTAKQRANIQEDIEQRQELFGVGAEADEFVTDVTGSEEAGNFARGVGKLPGDAASATAGITLGLDTGVQVGRNLGRTVDEYGADAVGYNILETGGQATEGLAEAVEENPYETAGSITGALAGGALLGKGAGKAGRFTRDRVRTAGGTKVDLDDITQESVRRNVETDGAEGDRFPGAADEDLYQRDPAEAVRQQAKDNTPEEVEKAFEDAGVDDGVVLKKALDTEPEGPGRGRSSQGFESAPGESLEDFDYETPGSFVGPELSPNFLRASGSSTRFSLRPGLPDFGNRPTGVLAKTDVENPRASNLDEFNEEMIDRAGESTARTKPASEVSVGEIEAVIPPGSKFSDIGGGTVRNTLRRVGVGSDFYTTVSGRRVPLRPVTPDNRRSSPDGDGDGLDSGSADVESPGVFTDRSLDELYRPVEEATDRPVPVPPAGPSGVSSAPDTDSVDSIGESVSTRSGGGMSESSISDADVGNFGFGSLSSPTGGSGDSSGPSKPSDPSGGSSPGSSTVSASSGFGSSPGGSGGSGGSGGFGGSGGGGGSPGGSPVSPPISGPPSSGLGSPSTPGSGSPFEGSPVGSTPPSDPPARRVRPPSPSGKKKDDEFEGLVAGVGNPEYTDFIDPLTGEVLETERGN